MAKYKVYWYRLKLISVDFVEYSVDAQIKEVCFTDPILTIWLDFLEHNPSFAWSFMLFDPAYDWMSRRGGTVYALGPYTSSWLKCNHLKDNIADGNSFKQRKIITAPKHYLSAEVVQL